MTSCDNANGSSDRDSQQESATSLESGSRLEMSRVAGLRRRAFAQLASVVVAILAITAYAQFAPNPTDRGDAPAHPHAEPPPPEADGPRSNQEDEPTASQSNEAVLATKPSGGPSVAEVPDPPPAATTSPPAHEVDRTRVAGAESALDAASRDRARADERAAESARRLARAANQSALDALTRSQARIPAPRSFYEDRPGCSARWVPSRRARQARDRGGHAAQPTSTQVQVDPQ